MWIITPALLVLVAIVQRWRVRALGQSAWKGGGFGMFADIDRYDVTAEVWVEDRSGLCRRLKVDRRILPPKVKSIPTRTNLLEFARMIASSGWHPCGDVAYRCVYDSGHDRLRVVKVAVRLLLIDFDGKNGIYTAAEKAVFTMPGPTRAF